MTIDYYDVAETWSRDHIAAAQLTRLRSLVEHSRKCAFYRERLDAAGVTPDSLRTLDDVRKIPFTTKDDLRSQYPTGLLCVPQRDIVRMHCSSGTTGTPVAICHTQNDINTWADLMARCLYMVGVRPDDVFQNMSGYGLFTGGLGIHFGAERLGCMTIPAGPGNSRRQIKLVKDFRTTVAHILPSYALILAEQLREMGENPADLSLRIAVVGAEPYTEAFRKRIEDIFAMKAFNSYGHGEVGELVMTNLCREGMPILRYRTRDLTRFLPGECACGRQHRRMDRILGRADDMFIIKGVNVYPMQIEKVIMGFPEVGQNYLILLENDGLGDVMRVQVEVRDEYFVEDMRILHNLQNTIARRLRDEILVTPRVELVQSSSLPCNEGGKAVRVQDRRATK